MPELHVQYLEKVFGEYEVGRIARVRKLYICHFPAQYKGAGS